MFDLSLNQIGVLAAGLFLIVAGVAGMMPLLLNQRHSASGRLRIDESLNPALSAMSAFVRPIPAPFATGNAPVALSPKPSPTAGPASSSSSPDVLPTSRLREGEISAAEELLAKLFTIRMTLSDVTEEIHTLRDMYNLDDDGIVEDIDDVDDDLRDIEQDVEEEEAPVAAAIRRVRKAA